MGESPAAEKRMFVCALFVCVWCLVPLKNCMPGDSPIYVHKIAVYVYWFTRCPVFWMVVWLLDSRHASQSMRVIHNWNHIYTNCTFCFRANHLQTHTQCILCMFVCLSCPAFWLYTFYCPQWYNLPNHPSCFIVWCFAPSCVITLQMPVRACIIACDALQPKFVSSFFGLFGCICL